MSAASPENTYREALKRLTDEFDGLDAEKEAPSPTVKAYWDAVDGLLSARGADVLAEAAKDDEFLTIKTQPLNGSILVAVSHDQFGHLAVLDHGKVDWSSATDSAAPGCWRGAPERPCSATEIGLVPAETSDAARFYVAADYAQDAGGTRGHQLSLWRWKNGKAQAFFTTDYVTGGDAPQGVAVTGDEIKITSKGFWEHFSVCGSCDGRQQEHRLHLTPTGVEDLGITSLTPQLDTIDTLLGRLADKRPTGEIATPEATALLKKSWHGNIFIIDPPLIGDHTACLAPDDLPALTFRFTPDSGVMRITAIESGACG